MRDFDETTFTEAVLEQFQNTPDPRLKTIITSLVRHLHAFARDVDLTFDEWSHAIQFLTRTGQICGNGRQEFVLLSDVLGFTMLVDSINHRMPDGATATTVLGPFYVEGPPEFPMGFDISRGVPGEKLYVEGVVASASGERLANAEVDVWQSDTDGFYDVQRSDLSEPTLRGRFHADAQGRFHFWSILPSPYPIPYDGPVGDLLQATARHPWRPAHLHFMISSPGHEKLVTHLFVRGSKYLDSDAVFGVKHSLIRDYKLESPGVAPDGKRVSEPWRSLSYTFNLKQLDVPVGQASEKAETVR